MITKEDIKKYIDIEKQLDDLAYNIFNYIYNNYIQLLEFEKHSSYDDYKIENDKLIMKYYDSNYDLYEYNHIGIPLKYIYNDSWKEYVEDLEDERIMKYVKQLKKDEEDTKERELKLLKELKEKYE